MHLKGQFTIEIDQQVLAVDADRLDVLPDAGPVTSQLAGPEPIQRPILEDRGHPLPGQVDGVALRHDDRRGRRRSAPPSCHRPVFSTKRSAAPTDPAITRWSRWPTTVSAVA